jgi:hypothetical protein
MMNPIDLVILNQFIVKAKTATYVGNGQPKTSCRLGSHDLEYIDSDFVYRDSYFGGQDFLGEEAVWFQQQPVWGENYYGKVLRPDLITAEQTGLMIKRSLMEMYSQGRFLGGFQYFWEDLLYMDENSGNVESFYGTEEIRIHGVLVYRLHYHGGMIL